MCPIEANTSDCIAPVVRGVPERIATLLAVVVPFLAIVIAFYGFWGWGLSWTEVGILAVMYTVTALGVTIGYHRLFTHRSFQTYRILEVLLAVMGSMAVQGPLIEWVATHRRHHQHSDSAEDPHSPHRHGEGFFAVLAGWWHAHVGWLFRSEPVDLHRYARDIRTNAVLNYVSRLFVVWVSLGLGVPALIGGLITGTWFGALLGFLWGGLVRVFLVHHVTWSINSVCHLWGTRPFETRDESRNNAICGVLAFGEGWHNNHHAFPTSARHGLRWWQLDMSYLIIRAMQSLGLAWRVRLPAAP